MIIFHKKWGVEIGVLIRKNTSQPHNFFMLNKNSHFIWNLEKIRKYENVTKS